MANLAQMNLLPGEKRDVKISKIAYPTNNGICNVIRFTFEDKDKNLITQDFNAAAPAVLYRFLTGIVSQQPKAERKTIEFMGTATTINQLPIWKFTATEKEVNKKLIGKEFTAVGNMNSKGFLNLDSLLTIASDDEEEASEAD